MISLAATKRRSEKPSPGSDQVLAARDEPTSSRLDHPRV